MLKLDLELLICNHLGQKSKSKLTSVVSDLHFITEISKNNLIKEGYPNNSIHITGNTAIDSLIIVRDKISGK